MTRFIAIAAVLFLAACASPALKMTTQEIQALNDNRLCSIHNSYDREVRVEAEVNRRNLICDRHVRECLARGNQPGTEAMGFCVATLRENERLRYEASRDDFYFMHGHHHHYHRRGSGVGVGIGF